MAARNIAALESTAKKVRERGGDAEALALDISDIARTADVVAATGPFDILVNSAGTARRGQAGTFRWRDIHSALALIRAKARAPLSATLLAALYPAWQAARLSPGEGLRYE